MSDSEKGGFGFPKSERLRVEKDFKALFERGFRLRGRLMMMAIRRGDGTCSRAGIVAGRRVGNAVVRSRAKRLLREAYRHEKHRLSEPCDLALVASPNIKGAKLDEVREEVRRLLEKAVEKIRGG